MRIRKICYWLTLVALTLTIWAQGLIICGECGREAAPGAKVCSHCQAVLPQAATVEVPAAPEPQPVEKVASVEATVAELAYGEVAANVRQAREFEARQPTVALAYYQNALAVMRLIPAGRLSPEQEQWILKGNREILQMLQRGTRDCKFCNGSGTYQLDISKVGGLIGGAVPLTGIPCKACGGSGKVQGLRDVAELKKMLLDGRTEFERRQIANGDVREGRALISPQLSELLTVTQKALVRTGMPKPCAECQLTGRQACSTCRTTGWVKCTNPGCRNGIMESATTNTRRTRSEVRMNQDSVIRCQRCGGIGEVSCIACKGSGSIVCKKCDGSGLAKECTRCIGAGLVPCQRCRGSGELRGATCPDCRGDKVMLCPSCNGEGAMLR